MAAGGALLLLAVAILVRALCCCRQHLATKKSQLSVAYHSSSQCFQYSNWSSSMAAPGVEPVLTVRLDSRDRHRTLCWKEALSCVVFGRAGRQLVMSVAVCVVMPQDWQNIDSTNPLPHLVYSCKGDDDIDIVLNCQVKICKETLCSVSLSLMDVASVAVFFFVPLRSLLLTFHTMLLLMRGLKSE